MIPRKILDEFLALRRASQGSPHDGLDGEGACAPTLQESISQSTVERGSTKDRYTRGSAVTESKLAACVAELLAAHPAARPVKDRLSIADYVARGIVHRFGEAQRIVWQTENSLRTRKLDASWVAQCPAGHMTSEMIDCHQVVGWACAACNRVYDTTECHVVPRKSGPRDPGDWT